MTKHKSTYNPTYIRCAKNITHDMKKCKQSNASQSATVVALKRAEISKKHPTIPKKTINKTRAVDNWDVLDEAAVFEDVLVDDAKDWSQNSFGVI